MLNETPPSDPQSASLIAIAFLKISFVITILAAAGIGFAGNRWFPGQFPAGKGHENHGATSGQHVTLPPPAAAGIGRTLRVSIIGLACWWLPVLAAGCCLGCLGCLGWRIRCIRRRNCARCLDRNGTLPHGRHSNPRRVCGTRHGGAHDFCRVRSHASPKKPQRLAFAGRNHPHASQGLTPMLRLVTLRLPT